jgi:NAD(P)H dehydrogenase (quinone)
MTEIAIVYFSGAGHTHLMAEAIATGCRKVSGTNAELLRVTGEQIVNGRWQNDGVFLEKLHAADGIIFGSPTYMGGVTGQFKSFIDAASSAWFQQLWKDKVAGGFTHSGSLSGDKQSTLLYLAVNAAQHAMIWVGNDRMPDAEGVNRLGSFLGIMGQSNLDFSGAPAVLDNGDRLTAEHYGQRIATVAQGWRK